MTNEKDGEILNRIINIECGRDDNGFATCSPSALQTSISAALATVRADEREAAFKEMIGVVAGLPMQGTMNYRRGYEEGVRDALRTLEVAATENRKGEG